MKYPKLRELKEAIKALILGPYTTKFPKKPHTPMPKFRGKPVPDEDKCIACGACAQVCPARAIEIKNNLNQESPTREIIWSYDLCIYCGQCERLCTTEDGVKLNLEYDLAAFDRTALTSKVEKELILCEKCGEILGTKAQLLWIFKKIGPLSSGNFNLIYNAQRQLGFVGKIVPVINSPDLQRSDLYRILCPKCRHLVLVYNQTGKQ